MVESIKGKKLNKGEWAEFYVMMKLLGEGRLYTANKLLQKNYQSYLDVLKIIRQECETQVLEYIIDEANGVVIVKPQDSDTILATMPVSDFNDYAKMLFDGIKDIKGSILIHLLLSMIGLKKNILKKRQPGVRLTLEMVTNRLLFQ